MAFGLGGLRVLQAKGYLDGASSGERKQGVWFVEVFWTEEVLP
jgi:hypothetical protein